MVTAAERKKAEDDAAAHGRDPGNQGTTTDQDRDRGVERGGAATHGATSQAAAGATALAPRATATAPVGPDTDANGKTADQLHQEQGASKDGFQFAVPKTMVGADGIDTLMDACERYGINPDPDIVPRELLSWKHYGADMTTSVPGYVQLVTGGGLKIRHYDDPEFPMDPDTEERLRGVFNAYVVDPVTKLPRAVALPDDHTLPLAVVDGIGRAQDHRYRGGYLKQGGKVEAAKRMKERKTRPHR